MKWPKKLIVVKTSVPSFSLVIVARIILGFNIPRTQAGIRNLYLSGMCGQ